MGCERFRVAGHDAPCSRCVSRSRARAHQGARPRLTAWRRNTTPRRQRFRHLPRKGERSGEHKCESRHRSSCRRLTSRRLLLFPAMARRHRRTKGTRQASARILITRFHCLCNSPLSRPIAMTIIQEILARYLDSVLLRKDDYTDALRRFDHRRNDRTNRLFGHSIKLRELVSILSASGR